MPGLGLVEWVLCSLVSVVLSDSYKGVVGVSCLVGNSSGTLIAMVTGRSRYNVFLGTGN